MSKNRLIGAIIGHHHASNCIRHSVGAGKLLILPLSVRPDQGVTQTTIGIGSPGGEKFRTGPARSPGTNRGPTSALL